MLHGRSRRSRFVMKKDGGNPTRGPAVPTHIAALNPYQPGKPIEEVERELGLRDSIKLASNENPLGPSKLALEALERTLGNLHRYPDGGAVALTERLAQSHSVDRCQIILGNGSNEIIELIARTFVDPDGEVVMSADGFLIYHLVTQAVGAKSVRVPPRGYSHDLDAMAAAINASTRVVFIASPNNPTGTIIDRVAWKRFIANVPPEVLVVVDHAYIEFVDDDEHPDPLEDLGAYPDKHPGVVVLRTFSKIFGLAGLRVGYGVGGAGVIEAMARVRQPFNVNLPAQAAALAALDDTDHIERSCALARAGRERYRAAFERLGLEFVESHANFVLVGVGRGSEVTEALLHRGVIVRPMDVYGMPDKIRITFGTEEEDERCIAALEAVLRELGS